MVRKPQGSPWKTLDRDLKRIVQMEQATAYVSRPLVSALIFLMLNSLL